MIRHLSVLILLLILFSCNSDKENSEYLEFSNFTINGKNTTSFAVSSDTISCKDKETCFYSLPINEKAVIQVSLPPGPVLPIRWKIEGEYYEGSEVNVNFPTAGVKEIILQVVGHKEIFKYIKVSDNISIVGSYARDIDSTPNIAENTHLDGKNSIVGKEPASTPHPTKGGKVKIQKPNKSNGIQNNPDGDVFGPPPPPPNNERVLTRPGKPGSKSQPNTVIVTKQTTEPKRVVNVEFTKTRTEGASYTQPCNSADYESTASVTISPSTDLELESVSVICNNGGTIQVTVLQNGNVIGKLSNRTANKGRTQIRLSTMDAILEAGSTYQLIIKGGAGVEFANLTPCNVKGGGNILNPRYNKVTIFDIKFNY